MTTETVEQTPTMLIEWSEFVARLQWKQGEHVALIGPTGMGKTNLAFYFLPQRKYITILATKPKDESLDRFAKEQGFKRYSEWPKLATARRAPRRMIWPKDKNLHTMVATQKVVFDDTLNQLFSEGGWTVYIDELWWFCQTLGLTKYVKILLQQARSMRISLVVAAQRPAWIPVEVFDQATHLFFWRDPDIRNLQRVGGVNAINSRAVMNVVMRLPEYHVLYVNSRTSEMMVTRPPGPKEGGKK